MLIKKFVALKRSLMALGCLGAISTSPLRGQVPPDASPTATPDAEFQALPQTPDLSASPTPAANATPTSTPIVPNPSGEPGDPTRSTHSTFWLDSYPLNDLFQYL